MCASRSAQRSPSHHADQSEPSVQTLWSIDALGRTWTGGLNFLSESHGWEFTLRRDGAFAYSRRLMTHHEAQQEVESQRRLVLAMVEGETQERAGAVTADANRPEDALVTC